MSDTARMLTAAAVLVVVTVAAFFLLPFWDDDAPPPVRIESLEAWVALSHREGFELLDKQAFDDYFIAVYRTDADEIAFCYRWRGGEDAPDTSFGVRDPGGASLRDDGRTEEATGLNPTGPLPGGAFVDGVVLPIRTGYQGPVMLVFRDNRDDPDTIPGREVYLRTVDWNR